MKRRMKYFLATSPLFGKGRFERALSRAMRQCKIKYLKSKE